MGSPAADAVEVDAVGVRHRRTEFVARHRLGRRVGAPGDVGGQDDGGLVGSAAAGRASNAVYLRTAAAQRCVRAGGQAKQRRPHEDMVERLSRSKHRPAPPGRRGAGSRGPCPSGSPPRPAASGTAARFQRPGVRRRGAKEGGRAATQRGDRRARARRRARRRDCFWCTTASDVSGPDIKRATPHIQTDSNRSTS